MKEQSLVVEKLIGVAEIGLLALAVNFCTPPSSYDAYYLPLTNHIVYNHGSENDPQVVAHETFHKLDANAHPGGRLVWGLRYMVDREFACLQELEANFYAGYEDVADHPACE